MTYSSQRAIVREMEAHYRLRSKRAMAEATARIAEAVHYGVIADKLRKIADGDPDE